jgi:hypothetical protein
VLRKSSAAKRTLGKIMGHFSKYLVGGFAAVLAMHYLAAPAGNGPGPLSRAFSAAPSSGEFLQATNQSGKSDRLQAVRGGETQPPTIATVEVIGLRDAAIIYRDRDGKVLFRTDPMANVTVVTKNLTLPEVTIKETPRTSVQRVAPAAVPTTLQERKHSVGCDPAFSPVASPSLSHLTGRCLVELQVPVQVASLN